MTHSDNASSPILEFRQISKSFPGVKALSDVSFSVYAGEVHGLMGENGAGKSTLLKVLGGQYQPEEGTVFVNGQAQRFSNSRMSMDAGIAIIHQELQYVPDLTVMDNLLLGHLPQRFGFIKSQAAMKWVEAELKRLKVDLDPRARLRDLSIGQRQMVEICKALIRDAKVIALDEPTSSLSHQETKTLFRLVHSLRDQGKAMIYISHRMDEIFTLCDSCTIFRDGKKVAEHRDMKQITRTQLVQEMVGREIKDIFAYRPREHGQTRLDIQGISGKKIAKPISFSVKSGEILGLFGLVGAGRSELLRLVCGADSMSTGQISLDGQVLKIRNPSDAIRAGIVLCPEDRKEEGIVPCRPVSENINISCRRHSSPWGFLNHKKEVDTADSYIKSLAIKTPSRNQLIRFLSGGNQQKAILARWLAEEGVKVLVIDEPTRGIDVGAKNEIYRVLYDLAEKGLSIIMISSELPEVMGVSDRILIMCQGQINDEIHRADYSETKILEKAFPVEELLTTE